MAIVHLTLYIYVGSELGNWVSLIMMIVSTQAHGFNMSVSSSIKMANLAS